VGEEWVGQQWVVEQGRRKSKTAKHSPPSSAKPQHLPLPPQTTKPAVAPTRRRPGGRPPPAAAHAEPGPLLLRAGLEGDCGQLLAVVLEPLLADFTGYQVWDWGLGFGVWGLGQELRLKTFAHSTKR